MSKLFPELLGQAAPDAVLPASVWTRPSGDTRAQVEASAAPAAAASSPRGPHSSPTGAESFVVGGAASLRRFAELLGLSGEGACGYQVRAARASSAGYLELGLSGEGGAEVTVRFSGPDAPSAFLRSDHYSMTYRGEGDEALLPALRRAHKRLERATLPLLLKVLLVDPEHRVERSGEKVSSPSGGPGSDARRSEPLALHLDPTRSLVQVYGWSEAWLNFFADKEQQRNFCHNVSGSIVTVGHEDLECHYATPPTNDGTVSFFNYPSVHERYTPVATSRGEGGDVAPTPSEAHSNYLISDLGDLDIIKGGARKLDRLLDSILERPEKPETVLVRATCVPIVIGDDMEGSVDRFRKKSGLEVIYLDNIADGRATPFASIFQRVKDSPAFRAPVKRPRSINLVGFPSEREMAPLLAFLETLGVSLNTRLLPEVDVEVMKRFTAAELSVLFDSILYAQSYAEVLGGIELPSIRPMAPYGVILTRAWLRAIAEALGVEAGFDGAFAEAFARPLQRFEELRRAAAGYRLGFVIDADRALMLQEPRRLVGIPVVAALEEMGFALDYLVYAPRGIDAHQLLPALPSESTRVFPFKSPEELRDCLRDSEAQAFYSELFFDRRLTRCGKAQFSSKHFRMGVHGACDTLQSLLGVVRLPFYRKYSDFLGAPFHG